MTRSPDALVVGAGVVGLTTAISLAEAGLRTHILAAAPPQQSTSFVAGAIWGPVRTGGSARSLEWSRVGLEVLSELAAEPRAAIRQVSGVEVAATAATPPGWISLLPQHRLLEPGELPDGYASGWRYTAPVVTMPRYLPYLVDRLTAAGGTVEYGAPLTSLRPLAVPVKDGPVKDGPLKDGPVKDVPLIVNCTGIGARDLVPDPAVTPVRGQVVIVENPGIEEFFRHPSDGPESTYIFPHGDVVLLGGTAEEGAWDLTPDPATTTRILRDCCAVEPRLSGSRIVAERVGLRPYRPQVRLEAEDLSEGRVLWHNYGHGGAGVTLAWGCARELTETVVSLAGATARSGGRERSPGRASSCSSGAGSRCRRPACRPAR